MKSDSSRKKNLSGRAIGAVLLAAAVLAVLFYRADPEEAPAVDVVRPVKSLVVGESLVRPVLRLPGTVDAAAGVDLSFEVPGRIVEFPVLRGSEVEKGDVLAKLDDSDFKNRVKDAQAQLDVAESTLKRMKKALKINAVSEEDHAKAKASRDVAKAQLAIAKKALEDSVLRAKFSGMVAETYADNFQTVAAGAPVLKLQDVSVLQLDVQVPESYLIRSGGRGMAGKVRCSVSFDALPGRSFPVTLKEFSTSADPVTQTYRATFTLVPPEADQLAVLPGMTGTVSAEIPADAADGEGAVQVPSDVVGIESDGSFFVWVLTAEDGGTGVWTASKRPVVPAERSGNLMTISEGLSAGERIAAAGITLLTEGRRLKLLEDAGSAGEAAPAPAP